MINEGKQIKPFLLKPAAKDYLWGGNRLNEDFGKEINLSPLAETWECSVHPEGPSVIASGAYTGRTLAEVLQWHPEWIGKGRKEFPILVKLIDAKQDLAVQVHPDDAYARENENGQLGKTEMWYVLDAEPGATLIYGLNRTLKKDELKNAMESGTLEQYLQRVPVEKGQVFFIEPGRIHAIGAGVLVAEVQESSDLTYRLYDFNRVDKDGRKRELHVKKALDVADLMKSGKPCSAKHDVRLENGYTLERLSGCEYFEVYCMHLNTECCRTLVDYKADDSYRVLLCVDGCGSFAVKGEVTPFFKGDCIFVPAESEIAKLHGKARLLDIRG